MTKAEYAQELRNRTDVKYNCAQAVLTPFAEECGISAETAFLLAEPFAGGMKMGSVCGVLTGALMVIGLKKIPNIKAKIFWEKFHQANGYINCSELLEMAKEKGIDKKILCDGMIVEAVKMLEELTK